MQLTNGSLIFVTRGSKASLSALPHIAPFAQTIGCHLKALYIYRAGKRDQMPSDREQEAAISKINDAMPAEYALQETLISPPAALYPSVRQLANSHNGALQERMVGNETSISTVTPLKGMITLLPSRRRGIIRLILANDYETLLHNGPLPILALPPNGKIGQIKKVLFPLDLSQRSQIWFGEVTELCKKLNAELHLLHVFGSDVAPRSKHDQERRLAAQGPSELYNLDKEHIREYESQSSQQGVQTVVQTVEGRAHSQIMRYAKQENIDLITMVSHGPRSAEDILRGSTTVRVIQQAQMPVLALYSYNVPA
ncbi:MAG: universal stress protein [Chloroflexi bacterium AL-W]|nr:universal stress protein [Chloroflexi bacterium AL-N1]NOK70253.1 universal stress protein [Chloroflexi bacterium AL-N10]NOK77790.1 universal stress protein [Chloroflexi bacterium AL-N5]NOK84799.1 universal stress protein [Chloroflexi bacterium AL-W]NOK92406.1 universal stress protein [Chloroflexi bacterium AL-N15]